MPAVANPVPLGLFSFAATGLLLSFLNINVRGVHNGNIVRVNFERDLRGQKTLGLR